MCTTAALQLALKDCIESMHASQVSCGSSVAKALSYIAESQILVHCVQIPAMPNCSVVFCMSCKSLS